MDILTKLMLAASDGPRAPNVGSVILSDVAGGNRFTSTAFPVAVTMADDGNPLSTKGMKAYVQGNLVTYAQTSQITNVSTTGADLTQIGNWSGVPFNTGYIATVIMPVSEGNWVMFRHWRSGDRGNYFQNSTLHRLSAANPLTTTIANWTEQSATWHGGNNIYIRQSRSLLDAGPSWWAIRSDTMNGNGGTENSGSRLETSAGTMFGTFNRDANNVGMGCQAHQGTNYFFYGIVTNNSSSNTYWRRLTNGGNQVTLTTQGTEYWSGGYAWDKSPPSLYRLSNNEYYLNNSGGEILQGSSTTFQTLASLGRSRPPIPSYTLFQKENILYFVYNGTAWITDDMISYRTQPFNQTPASGHTGTSWGYWNGWAWTATSRRSNDGRDTNWVSLDDCQTWFAPAAGDNSYPLIYYTASHGGVVFETAPCHWRQSYSGYWAPRHVATLTLSDSTDVSKFEANEQVTEVTSGGSTGDAKGMVLSSSGSTLKVQYATGTFDIGNSVKTGAKAIDNASLYCVLNNAGAVTSLQPSDPGFVTQTATPTQVSFPGTFSPGNAPDVDLPAGTTLTVQVNATNIEGTDSATSNTITPS